MSMKQGYQFNQSHCHVCGKVVYDNWYVRHCKEEHPESNPHWVKVERLKPPKDSTEYAPLCKAIGCMRRTRSESGYCFQHSDFPLYQRGK